MKESKTTPDPRQTPFQRFTDLARRIVGVRKSEIAKKRRPPGKPK